MVDQGSQSGFPIFTSKFPHEMTLVTCPRAFGLRRLAQSVGRGLGISPSPPHHHSQHHHLPPP